MGEGGGVCVRVVEAGDDVAGELCKSHSIPSASDIGRVTWNFAKLVILMFQDNKVTRMMRVEAPRQFLPNVRSSGLAFRLALAKG